MPYSKGRQCGLRTASKTRLAECRARAAPKAQRLRPSSHCLPPSGPGARVSCVPVESDSVFAPTCSHLFSILSPSPPPVATVPQPAREIGDETRIDRLARLKASQPCARAARPLFFLLPCAVRQQRPVPAQPAVNRCSTIPPAQVPPTPRASLRRGSCLYTPRAAYTAPTSIATAIAVTASPIASISPLCKNHQKHFLLLLSSRRAPATSARQPA